MSSDLTPARLEELLAAATQGPWEPHLVDETLVVSGSHQIATTNIDGTYDEGFRRMAADAALIALSPALAARVIELEAERHDVRNSALEEAARLLETMIVTGPEHDDVNHDDYRDSQFAALIRGLKRTALETPNAD